MFLICFGTRPELIKLIPLIHKFVENKIPFKTLFSGQHQDMIQNFFKYINTPDFVLENIMEHNQGLNHLSSKIMSKMDSIFNNNNITHVIVQGDTTTAFSIALSAFHKQKKIIHIEAGLRTYDKYSPFPEELNRRLISQIADIHFCPTEISINNLKKEDITENIFLVGNTIVDSFEYILKNTQPTNYIQRLINEVTDYIIITLHRRENRGEKIYKMWEQINILSDEYNLIYVTHPSLPESKNILKENIKLLEPQTYENMVHLISNSHGIITDSGGLQEEAVCANKRVLICRDTTERQETVDCGLGKLIGTHIIENIDFFNSKTLDISDNPYGYNVCDKIIQLI